jgi:succinate dehydrogenase / fumarate reductase flavoprotein subunit
LVFGKRAGEFAAKFAKADKAGRINSVLVDEVARKALEPFERAAVGEGPYQVQRDLQELMQDLVGIVRRGDEMARALESLQTLYLRAGRVHVIGNREYNPGWHTALDLTNLLTVSEAITRSALERKESRGAHFRDDYPNKDSAFGKVNSVIWKGRDGTMQFRLEPLAEMPAELKKIVEEMK